MKRILFIVLICLLGSSLSFAKGNPSNVEISADSLLTLFSKYSPFEVLEKVDWWDVNYRDCYSNKKLIPFFLAWIDKEAVFKNRMENYIKGAFDSDYKIYCVKGWLINHKRQGLIDTVLKDSALFNTYLDSVISEITIDKRKLFFSSKKWIDPNAFLVHTWLRLPEAYEILRKLWGEEGSYQRESAYFDAMLAMHDPKAVEIYNQYVDSLVNTDNVAALSEVMKISENAYRYGSYAIDLKLRLLKVRPNLKAVVPSDSSFPYPFIINVVFPVFSIHFVYYKCLYESDNNFIKRINNALFTPASKIYDLPFDELVKYAEEIRVNAKEIEKAFMPCRQELIEKEQYWKENMPYYKNKYATLDD